MIKNEENKQLITIFLICMAIYLLSYFSLFMIEDYYFIDDNWALVYSGSTCHIERGGLSRLLSCPINWLLFLNGSWFDFSPLSQILCLVFITLAGLIIVKLFTKKYHYLYALPICILGLFPLFWENMYYTSVSVLMGLSVLFACIPFLFINKPLQYGVASILCVLGIMTSYQVSLSIYPIITIFYAFDCWLIKGNFKKAFNIAVISLISFVIALIIFRVFIYQPFNGHVNTDLVKMDYIKNFSNTIYFLKAVFPMQTGMFWLICFLLTIFLITFFRSTKNKILAFVIIPLVVVAFILSIFVPLLFQYQWVYRYYIPLGFLIMLLSIYSYSLLKKFKWLKNIFTIFLCITVLHLMAVTTAAGKATQEQWKYEKYRLTLAIDDLLDVIENQNDYKITFINKNIKQNKVGNIRNGNKIYYNTNITAFKPNFVKYAHQWIFERYIPQKKGNPQCNGNKEIVTDNLFHTISKQGDYYTVSFNEDLSTRKVDNTIKPNLNNICYQDNNWKISYAKYPNNDKKQ